MPNSWMTVLNSYEYPVDLREFNQRNIFPNNFKDKIAGDRKSTHLFEDYFRENAKNNIAVFIEVIYWKLYSQSRIKDKTTGRIADYLTAKNIKPSALYNEVLAFTSAPSIFNLSRIRNSLGIATNVIAVALTFPAFMDPINLPMVDNQVARWVNMNYKVHNIGKTNKLTPFIMNYTSLRDNDFENYLNWVLWCKEMSLLLSEKTEIKWRARDVEMAVFTSQRSRLHLNPISVENKLAQEKANKSDFNKGSAYKTKSSSSQEYEVTLQLGEEQYNVYNLLEKTNDNLFITGRAGTGKSVLLRHFVNNTSKRVIVLAPTGIASINVGGQTLHSFFAFDHNVLDPKDVWINAETAQILKNTDAFIIDEISMVRSDVMECVSRKFQLALKNDLPFGGVQLIAFGDLFQLEPVIADENVHEYLEHNFGGAHFFFAPAIQQCNLSTYELKHIYRQKEGHFQELLSDIRHGFPSNAAIYEINTRTGKSPTDGNVLTIATTNQIVNKINSERLSELPGKLFSYEALLSGDLKECIHYTNQTLSLKVGAQVILLRNNWKNKKLIWANGTLAEVVKLTKNEIWVSIDKRIHQVEPVTWETRKHKYDEKSRRIITETVATFTQFPLALAWAMTIHKAQGKTFRNVVVDFGRGAFAHGQAYVALSRCETLGGLYLVKSLQRRDIIVNPAVLDFMRATDIKPSM